MPTTTNSQDVATSPDVFPRMGILVLGMHRSGTSAASGILNILGAVAPGELIPAADDNRKGFFENRRFVLFNDRVLESLGSSWDDPLPLSDRWMASPVAGAAVAELATIIEEECGSTPFVAIKDPRICRLAPLWIDAMGAARRKPVALLPLRHPSEVVRSVGRRNGTPKSQVLLAWLSHVVAAEKSSRGIARSFVTYDALLDDWEHEFERIASDLQLQWPSEMVRVRDKVASFLEGDLRNHRSDARTARATDALEALCLKAWDILAAATADPHAQALSDAMDELAASVETTLSLFGTVILELSQKSSSTTRELAQVSGTLQQLQSAHGELQAAHDALYAEHDELTRAHARFRDEAWRLEARLEARLARRDAQLQSANNLIAQRDGDLQGMQFAVTGLRGEVEQANAEIATIKASTSWRLTQPLRAMLVHSPILRKTGRRLLRGSWWVLTGQVVRRLGERKRQQEVLTSKVENIYAVTPADQLLSSGARWGIICTPHTEFIARCIGERLRSHGVSSFVSTHMPETFDDSIYIVLCPQMFETLPPGNKRIVFQLEQSVSSRWFTDQYFRALDESFAVLEYSLQNIAYLDTKAIRYPHVHYLPIGTSLNPRPPLGAEEEFDCDFLFYGDELSSPRRQRMLAALRDKFKVVVCNDLFGEQMAAQIRRARAVVNIHYYENALLEMPRIQESLSLGTPILSEATSDQGDYPELGEAVLFFEEGSISSMMAAATTLLDNIGRHRRAVAGAQAAGAERFTFMFDRFLAAIGALRPGEMSKKPIYLPSEGDLVALSLPETIARRNLLTTCIPKGATIFDGIRYSPGWIGAASSFCALARYAQSKKLGRLTVFEDDVLFHDEFAEKIGVVQNYLDKIHGEWDVFCGLIADLHPDCNVLGVDVFEGVRFVTIDKMVSMVYNVYAPSAIDIIANWDPDFGSVSTNTIDRFLENHERLRVVVALPFLVGHREDAASTLWGFQNTQYSEMICASEQKLVSLADTFETRTAV